MKTRFCPSPTGSMHIGNARTALFSALFARANRGEFLLRIEDTDRERSDERYTKQLMDDLIWLGLDWQEGPEHDKGNGPYWQSKRQTIYNKYYKVLQKEGKIYPCFCSEQALAMTRKTQLASGKPPRYSGKCAHLTPKEIEEKLKAGLKPTLRFRVPKNQTIEFLDLVKGIQRFQADDIGDFIVRRADGTPPFMYCNSIDDALMGVTHVVRGEDHVTNTPRQIMILQALGFPVPEYAHIALIMGFDGTPLGKRHGSASVADVRNQGILAKAFVNYLARLGHFYEDNRLMTLDELAKQFKAECLSQSPAKYDASQLAHWQKETLKCLDQDKVWQWMGEMVRRLVPENQKTLFLKTVLPNILVPDDAFFWANIIFKQIADMDDEKVQILKMSGEVFFNQALEALGKFGTDYSKICDFLKKQLKIKGKALFMPLRIALTGEMHGPELALLFDLIGLDQMEIRLNAAKALIASD